MPTSLTPPRLLLQAAAEQIAELRDADANLSGTVRDLYRELFTEFRSELELWFLGDLRDQTRPTRRDPTESIEYWTTELRDLIAAATPEMEDLLDETLTDAYEESHDRALWMLALGGVELEEPSDPGDFDAIKLALIAGGVAGIGYPARLRVWNQEFTSRWDRMLKASVVGGWAGDETLTMFDALASSFAGHVEGLATNELHRAGGLGAAAATQPYRDQLVGEVWLTRQDDGVCPRCRAKHLTITTEQPITNSHPGCRCIKVPIPLNLHQQPIDYVAFLQSIGRR